MKMYQTNLLAVVAWTVFTGSTMAGAPQVGTAVNGDVAAGDAAKSLVAPKPDSSTKLETSQTPRTEQSALQIAAPLMIGTPIIENSDSLTCNVSTTSGTPMNVEGLGFNTLAPEQAAEIDTLTAMSLATRSTYKDVKDVADAHAGVFSNMKIAFANADSNAAGGLGNGNKQIDTATEEQQFIASLVAAGYSQQTAQDLVICVRGG